MAGINEGDLLEGLSPHRFVGERHRAGAQTRGKAYAVRLQEALEDGDDALFEHLLNLDVETTSKGNRQRFITAMYLRCSDEIKAAIVAHPSVRMGEDVIGAELAFWVALLVKGGLLPDLFQELMGMMCTVWWDRWAEEAAQTDAEAAAQAEAQQQG